MKILIACLLFPLILHHVQSNAQAIKMNKEVEDIVLLGKDSIVQLAFELINEDISVQNFSSIQVLTNGAEVYVSLTNPIKYLPINTAFYGDVLVATIAKTISYGRIINGQYDEQNIPFYRPTEASKQSIQFVIEAINRRDVGHAIAFDHFHGDMLIREFESFYQVTIVSDTQEAFYKVDKGTARLFDSEHAALEAPPFEEEEEFIEIK